MINKGEGTKLTESYSWFTDEDVINDFLLTVEEISDRLPEKIRILGIGSGVGNLDYKVKEHLENKYHKDVSLIISDRQIKDVIKKDGVEIIEVDNKELPFEEDSFDLVIARSVTHYEKDTDNETKVLKELQKVLSPNGYFITEAPYFDNKEEAKLMRDIHSLLPKFMNLKTYDELLVIHKDIFKETNLAKKQPNKPLFVDKKDFDKRYDISDEIINKTINLINQHKPEDIPNVWTKDNNFGWSIKFAILICKN